MANYNSIRGGEKIGSVFVRDRMADFVHERHKPPQQLARPRELVIVCAPMRSNINLSRIARAAGCCGVTRMICCGPGKLDRKIARDAADTLANRNASHACARAGEAAGRRLPAGRPGADEQLAELAPVTSSRGGRRW